MKTITMVLITTLMATHTQALQNLIHKIDPINSTTQKTTSENKDSLRISSHFASEKQARDYFKNNKATFAWDLHNVLVSRTTWTFAQNGLGCFGTQTAGYVNKIRLCGQLTHALANYHVWQGIKNIIKSPYGKNKITESYFNMLKNNGYSLLYPELISFANNIFVENPGMAELLDRLENKADSILFSNIGKDTLQDIHTRNLFPRIFKGTRFKENSINNSYPQITQGIYSVWKSKPEAYTQFENYADCSEKKQSIIFVDDKETNIINAPKEWNCILFTSVEQLKNDLARLEIL